MFSTDIDSFDFKPQSADHVVKSVMEKLDKRGKGIVLMHDIHKTTAKALPMLLAELKAKGYKIVHVTAKGQVATLPEYDAAIEKEAKGLPQVGAERPMSSIVKTVEGASPATTAAPSNATTEPDGMPVATQSEPSAMPAAPATTTAAAPAAAPLPAAPASPPAAPVAGKSSSNEMPAGEDTDMTPATAATAPSATMAATPPSSPPPQATAATTAGEPAASSTTVPPPTTTSSVVRTVSGTTPAAEKPIAGEPPAQGQAGPHEAPKSLSERAKETWQLWFGQ